MEEFDEELKSAFEEIVGFSLSEAQWDQAGLGAKMSGMGLCRAMEIADAAYIASRVGAYDDCRGLDSQHVLDDGRERAGGITVLGEWLGESQLRYNAKVPATSRVNVNGESKVGKQGELAYKLEGVNGMLC